MGELLQPTHLLFILLVIIFILGPIVIPIRTAPHNRAHCTWSKTKAVPRLWIGVALIVISKLGPYLAPRTPFIAAAWLILFVAGVYQLAKALYRKRDIQSAESIVSQPIGKPPNSSTHI